MSESQVFGSTENWLRYDDRELPSSKWPLAQSPAIVFLIAFSYVIFCTKIGPDFMQNRRFINLTLFLKLYNFLQIVISILLVYLSRDAAFKLEYFMVNRYTKVFEQQDHLSNAGWWYFIAKIFEMIDTIIMVLRKKQSQVSVLHLYHHSSMVVYSWVFMRFFPCDNLVGVVLYNSMVHVVMYTYYFLACFGPHVQKYLWWKRYITILQLVQFSAGTVGCITTLILDEHAHRAPLILQLVIVVIFLSLFWKFYKKTYKTDKTL